MRRGARLVWLTLAGCSLGDFSGYSSGGAATPPPASPPAGSPDASTTTDGGGGPVARDAAADAPDLGAATFADDFNRADGVVGNGWLEKTPDIFKIVNQRVVTVAGSYPKLILYRAAAEDLLDLEVAIEVRFHAPNATGNQDPQIVARLQGPGDGSAFDGYFAFVDDLEKLSVARHLNTTETGLERTDLPGKLDAEHVYRLRLRVTGTEPVELRAALDRRKAPADAWEEWVTTLAKDNGSQRIKTAGSWGLTSDATVSWDYDNFVCQKL